MKPLLLLTVFGLTFNTSAQEVEKQRIAFRIGVLDYSQNIDTAWLSIANIDGVRIRKSENTGSSTSKVAEGELKLSRSNFSTSWLHANVINGHLAFYESKPIPQAEPPSLVALAKFEESKIPKMAYLLFLPSPGEKHPYRVIPIDASTSALPAASHLVINLTKNPVRGSFGEQRFRVDPNKRIIVSDIKKTNPRGYFQVYFDHGNETDWKRIAFTQWKSDPTAQRICLVYRAGPRVSIRTFNQFVKGVKAVEMPEDTRQPIEGPEE